MALFVDFTIGTPSTVFNDLFAICGCDGGLGEVNLPGNDQLAQVTYRQTIASVTANRLSTLINTNFANPIVISGMSTADAAGFNVSGGFTFLDKSTSPAVVRIIYDTTQCDGQGFWALDPSGTEIPLPNDVILYHELSHVFAFLTTGVTNDEVQATQDENDERLRDGLPLRDVNDHTFGCGLGFSAGTAPCGQSSSSAGGNCVIATAAYGSNMAPEVMSLRRLRDRVLRHTHWGTHFFECFFQQYYHFSPAVARLMQTDPRLRDNVRTFVVAPLVDFYKLALLFVEGGEDSSEFKRGFDSYVHRCQQHILEFSLKGSLCSEAASIPSLIEFIEADGSGDAHAGLMFALDSRGPSGETMSCLLNRVQLSVHKSQGREFSWGVMMPLGIWWRGLALCNEAKERGASSTVSVKWLAVKLTEWLVGVPLDDCEYLLDGEALSADLLELANTVFTNSEARYGVGKRVREMYDRRPVAFDIDSLLGAAGYQWEEARDGCA